MRLRGQFGGRGRWSGCGVEAAAGAALGAGSHKAEQTPLSPSLYSPAQAAAAAAVGRDPHKAQSLGGLRELRPRPGPASVRQLRGSAPAPSSRGAVGQPGGLRGCGWGTPPGSAGPRRCRAAAPPRCSSPSWSGGSCRCCRSAGHLRGDRDTAGSATRGTPRGAQGRARHSQMPGVEQVSEPSSGTMCAL